MCLFEDFEKISQTLDGNKEVILKTRVVMTRKLLVFGSSFNPLLKLFQIMLGPVMEIELVSPLDVVPKDIEIGVKHFLTVPEKTYFENAIYQEDKTHRVVKLTKGNSSFQIEHIDTKFKVSSEYFRTKNFVGKSLCHITTTAGIENHECLHASVKKFYVTERQDLCPHLKFNLKVFCVCEAA